MVSISYPPAYLPAYPPACLPTCLPTHLPVCLSACLPVCLQFPLLGQGPGQKNRIRSATSGRLMRQAAGAASGDGIHKELFRCMPEKPALPVRLTHDDILQGNYYPSMV